MLIRLAQNSVLPLAITVLAVLIATGGDPASQWLRYDRQGILNGELWRLVTGHLVHLGWKHLVMNIAGLLLIWVLFGRLLSIRMWLTVCLASAAGISGALLLFDQGLQWYVGLSGVLHGMFVAGAVASIASGYRAEILLLVLLAGKLVWEQLNGALPGSAAFAGGEVVVDAHLYGAIIGLLVMTTHSIFFRRYVHRNNAADKE